MSRSYKKAIYKDAGSYGKYYRIIKRHIKQFIRSHKYEFASDDFDKVIPLDKEIVNDYDICDWTVKAEYNKYYDDVKDKLKRK